MPERDPLDPATPPLEPVSGEEVARDEVTVADLAAGEADADRPWPTWTLHGTEGG